MSNHLKSFALARLVFSLTSGLNSRLSTAIVIFFIQYICNVVTLLSTIDAEKCVHELAIAVFNKVLQTEQKNESATYAYFGRGIARTYALTGNTKCVVCISGIKP
jgi:hypothetical protein